MITNSVFLAPGTSEEITALPVRTEELKYTPEEENYLNRNAAAILMCDSGSLASKREGVSQ